MNWYLIFAVIVGAPLATLVAMFVWQKLSKESMIFLGIFCWIAVLIWLVDMAVKFEQAK